MSGPELDLGFVQEGIVEIEPMSGRMTIRTEGRPDLDVHQALAKYEGQEIRVVIVPLSTIAQVAKMVEDGGMALAEVPVAGKPS